MHLTFLNDVIKYLYDFWLPVRRARWINRSHGRFQRKEARESTGPRDAGYGPLPRHRPRGGESVGEAGFFVDGYRV